MLSEIEQFVNWAPRRNPNADTWRDYRCDFSCFAASISTEEGAANKSRFTRLFDLAAPLQESEWITSLVLMI